MKLAKQIADQMRIDMRGWKEGELHYCCLLVGSRGDDLVGRDPKTIATYLRLQSSEAFRDGEFILSAGLATAATAINCDARNDHVPNWKVAETVLCGLDPASYRDVIG